MTRTLGSFAPRLCTPRTTLLLLTGCLMAGGLVGCGGGSTGFSSDGKGVIMTETAAQSTVPSSPTAAPAATGTATPTRGIVLSE